MLFRRQKSQYGQKCLPAVKIRGQWLGRRGLPGVSLLKMDVLRHVTHDSKALELANLMIYRTNRIPPGNSVYLPCTAVSWLIQNYLLRNWMNLPYYMYPVHHRISEFKSSRTIPAGLRQPTAVVLLELSVSTCGDFPLFCRRPPAAAPGIKKLIIPLPSNKQTP